MGLGKLILRATMGSYFFGHGMQKLASGWQYALQASHPPPVSQASKKAIAVSVMVGVAAAVVMVKSSSPPGYVEPTPRPSDVRGSAG